MDTIANDVPIGETAKIRSAPELWVETLCPSIEMLAVAVFPDIVSRTASSLTEAIGGEVISMILILDDTIRGAAIINDDKKIDPKIIVNFIFVCCCL